MITIFSKRGNDCRVKTFLCTITALRSVKCKVMQSRLIHSFVNYYFAVPAVLSHISLKQLQSGPHSLSRCGATKNQAAASESYQQQYLRKYFHLRKEISRCYLLKLTSDLTDISRNCFLYVLSGVTEICFVSTSKTLRRQHKLEFVV